MSHSWLGFTVLHIVWILLQGLSPQIPFSSRMRSLCKRFMHFSIRASNVFLSSRIYLRWLKQKALGLFRMLQTRWISLLEPLWRPLLEYQTLIVKMHANQAYSAGTKVWSGPFLSYYCLMWLCSLLVFSVVSNYSVFYLLCRLLSNSC